MAEMRLAAVAKDFGETKVIKPLNLSVEAGEFVVFVGPSGCGKSTLLRMIAGLEAVTSGQIFIGGKEVTSLPPVERGVAMVFQTYALYPHMTVEENIGFGLMIAGLPKREIREKVRRAAATLRLEPYLKRKPKQLSGGQRQRVAIGRAIVKEPRIFLFDEPLSNLDAELRVQMRLEIARLHQDLGVTMVYVTHDQVEAMTLANRIVVLRDGQIEQAGKPVDLYTDPANIFVAGFIGSPKMNFVPGRIILAEGDSVVVEAPRLGGEPFPVRTRRVVPSPGAEVTLGFRPEHTVEPGAGPTFPGRVELVELLGSVSYVYVLTAAGERVTLEHRHLTASRPGEELAFDIDPDKILLFDREGRRV